MEIMNISNYSRPEAFLSVVCKRFGITSSAKLENVEIGFIMIAYGIMMTEFTISMK